MSKDKVAAYQQQQKRNLSPREVEAMAFTKAALLLEDAKKQTGEIKANVMSLSIFVDKQTTKALRSSSASDLDVLININRNLAAGLRTNAETAGQTAQTGGARPTGV